MTIEYYAGFQLDKLKDASGNTFSLTISDGTNSFSIDESDLDAAITANIETATGLYIHGKKPTSGGGWVDLYDVTTRYGPIDAGQMYFNLAIAIELALEAEDGNATPVAISQDWTVTYNNSTERYTITTDAGSLSFSVTCNNIVTERLLGFPPLSASATSHSGDATPWGVVTSTGAERSFVTDDYHSADHGSFLVSDNGANIVGVGAPGGVLFQDWIQSFETHAKTMRRKASITEPFTYQHMFELLQRGHALVVIWSYDNTDDNVVCHLRDSTFKPRRAVPDYDDGWHIQFRTIVLGVLDTSIGIPG